MQISARRVSWLLLAVLTTACNSPAPTTTSSTTTSSPTTTTTTTTTTPAAADGSDTSACADGTCEIVVSAPVEFAVGELRFAVTELTGKGVDFTLSGPGYSVGGWAAASCGSIRVFALDPNGTTMTEEDCTGSPPPPPAPRPGFLLFQLVSVDSGRAVLRLVSG